MSDGKIKTFLLAHNGQEAYHLAHIWQGGEA